MTFSIVIPVYNVEKHLQKCLESIINQLSEDVEVILVDDGSTDNSGKICDYYAKKYKSNILVFHNENQGLLLTRRFGFEKSSGEYIICCDSDDYLESDTIEQLRKIIFKKKYDVIIYNSYIYNGETKRPFFDNIFTDKKEQEISKEVCLVEYLKSYRIVSMWSKCIKKTCFEINKDYTPYAQISNGEDTLQSLEVFSNANSFFYLNKCLYNYRVNTGMTSKFDPYYFDGFCLIIDQIRKKQEINQLDNIEFLIAIKLFSSLGRSITQARTDQIIYTNQFKDYLKHLYENKIVQKYKKNFSCLIGKIQYDHYLLVYLLLNKKFTMIKKLLCIKNKISM